MSIDFKGIQKTIDYKFDNIDLLQQAFVRKSYSQECGGENNEVLEFIGDKVLDLIVIKVMMERFGRFTSNKEFCEFKTKYSEGEFTKIKKELVEGKMLAHCIDRLGLHNYLIMGKGDCKNNVHNEDSVKEDLFESIIGAIAIDSNWNIDAIENSVELMLDINEFFKKGVNQQEDYVGIIQHWSQVNNNKLPDYIFRDNNYKNIFKNNDNEYICELRLDGIEYYFTGKAKTKTLARYIAAMEAYKFLDNEGILFTLKDEIGEPEVDKAINQLQELSQKGYCSMPEYLFEELIDKNGNSVWKCYCSVNEYGGHAWSEASSKKHAKKLAAYNMLIHIIKGDDE